MAKHSKKVAAELKRRRKLARERLSGNYSGYKRVEYGVNGGGYSEWWNRRLAPYFLVTLVVFMLLLMTRVYMSGTSLVQHSSAYFTGVENAKPIEIKKAAIYEFKLYQELRGIGLPIYSELEIELLDQNYNHVYGFYKDLWKEQFIEDGYRNVYEDQRMNFYISLQPGIYYLKAYSHNGYDKEVVKAEVYKRNGGILYLKFYLIVFGVILLVALLGSGFWGNPKDMLLVIPKVKNPFKDNWFVLYLATVIVIYSCCLYFAMSHYGYAGADGYNHAPTWFMQTEKVYYLG